MKFICFALLLSVAISHAAEIESQSDSEKDKLQNLNLEKEKEKDISLSGKLNPVLKPLAEDELSESDAEESGRSKRFLKGKSIFFGFHKFKHFGKRAVTAGDGIVAVTNATTEIPENSTTETSSTLASTTNSSSTEPSSIESSSSSTSSTEAPSTSTLATSTDSSSSSTSSTESSSTESLSTSTSTESSVNSSFTQSPTNSTSINVEIGPSSISTEKSITTSEDSMSVMITKTILKLPGSQGSVSVIKEKHIKGPHFASYGYGYSSEEMEPESVKLNGTIVSDLPSPSAENSTDSDNERNGRLLLKPKFLKAKFIG